MNRSDLETALANGNVRAFLRVIRAGESGQTDEAYQALYGWKPGNGRTFTDFSDHPKQAFQSPWGYTSAAGAYQAMAAVPGKVKTDTWGDFVRSTGPSDFSPHSQDLFAVWCINRRHALEAVTNGSFALALHLCRQEWASFPGNDYGQPSKAYAALEAVYTAYGGALSPAITQGMPPAAPEQPQAAPNPPTPTLPPPSYSGGAGELMPDVQLPEPQDATPEERTTDMDSSQVQAGLQIAGTAAAFLNPAVGAILSVVPQVAKLFGGESPVAQRNIAATQLVVDTVKQAIGARNEQDVVEKLQSDPNAILKAQQAIKENYFELHQLVEQAKAAQRQFILDYSGKKDVRTIVFNLTFPEVLALLMMFVAATGAFGVLFGSKQFSPELMGAIVTLMLIGGWTGVKEFYFGSSRGSDEKNATIAAQRQQPPQ